MISEHTGHYDVRGIPIHVGDLIRVKHYRHYRRREQMWLYFRVGKKQGRYVAHNWNDTDPDNHQCLLCDCGIESAEVLAQSLIEYDSQGQLITWNERKRKCE